MARSDDADVVVLGAGIVGVAAAHGLVARGLDVLLVEAAPSAGTGTSGRCDGNVLLQTKHDDLLVRLTRRGIDTFAGWERDLGVDLGLRQDGSLVLLTADLADQADARREDLRALGVTAEVVRGPDLARLEPHLADDVDSALYCADDAEVYVPAVVAALLDDAVARGCRTAFATTATEVLTDRRGVRGVVTSTGTVRTRHVVNALGPWSPRLVVPDVPPVPVRPRQGVLLATDACPGLVRHNLREASYLSDRADDDGTSTDAKVSFAAEPTGRGNLLVGSSRQFRGHDTVPDPAVVRLVLERAVRFVPALAGRLVIRAFAGLRPWSPDGLPLIGGTAALPGYVLATGHEGEGIGLAPATAEAVVAAVTGDDIDADVDADLREVLDTCSPDRFATSAPTPGAP